GTLSQLQGNTDGQKAAISDRHPDRAAGMADCVLLGNGFAVDRNRLRRVRSCSALASGASTARGNTSRQTMSAPHKAVRLVIAGAASLRGKELKDWLEESKFPAADIRLIDEEIVAG